MGGQGWEAVMELDTTGIDKEKKEIRKESPTHEHEGHRRRGILRTRILQTS